MILLRRLRVHALKQLRDVDIWFPRHGSILIEGQNEAGKSTIFEAIYFALYGAALVGEERRATLDDLIPHGAAAASVELTIVAGETGQTILEIQRSQSRAVDGRRRAQQARLVVRRAGARTEELHGPSAVNERIQQELSGLDGDALRNSCFMEQKALDRIEALSRDQREVAVAKLLGLERLSRIEREIEKACKEHAQHVELTRRMAQVAELRADAADRARHVAEGEARLRAARVRTLVTERDRVESGTGGEWNDEQHATAQAQRATLQARLERDESVADLLDRIEGQGVSLAELQAMQEQQRRDQDELDALAQVATDAGMLEARLDALHAAEITMRSVALDRGNLRRAHDVQTAQDEVTRALASLAEARESAQVAARAAARETLSRWIKLKEIEATVRDGDANIAALRKQHATDTVDRQNAQRAASRLLALAASGGALTILTVAAGVVWHLVWVLAVVLAVVCGLLAWRWMNARADVAEAEGRLAIASERLTEARATRETAERLAGGMDELLRGETIVRDAGLQPPTTVEEARSLLATLGDGREAALRKVDLQAAQAAAHLVSLRENELATARARLRDAQQTYQARGDNYGSEAGDVTPEQVAALHETLRRGEDELQQQLAGLGLAQQGERQQHEEQSEQEWQRLVAIARGEAEATLRQLRERLESREPLTRRIADRSATLERQCGMLAAGLEALGREAEGLALAPGAKAALGSGSDLDALGGAYERLRALVVAERDGLDAPSARVELAALNAKLTERERAHGEQQVASQATKARQAAEVSRLLREQGIIGRGDEPLEVLRTRWPLLDEVEASTTPELEVELQRLQNDAHHLRESASEQARTLGIAEDDALDVGACRERLAEAEATLRRHELALKLAEEVRGRIVRRVLPETEVFMRRLLPALTAGRYRDARLLAEEGNGADLRIALWDELAGRHVAKNLFSGGTRDQCSLALRLAFALATLPKELGALPGFIFLDEPLSSFDAERSHALVDVLTQGEIARQFAQVMLISHSQSIERESFRYHLRMVGGRVAASDLPDEHTAHVMWDGESRERGGVPTLPAV
ncbi:MAG TPA: AAA family ATPase [Ktedonobacterales bacterium]